VCCCFVFLLYLSYFRYQHQQQTNLSNMISPKKSPSGDFCLRTLRKLTNTNILKRIFMFGGGKKQFSQVIISPALHSDIQQILLTWEKCFGCMSDCNIFVCVSPTYIRNSCQPYKVWLLLFWFVTQKDMHWFPFSNFLKWNVRTYYHYLPPL